jgi:hypothetical protein
MNPLTRLLAALASVFGFYGCDAAHLADLKPGVSTAQEVRERLGVPGAEWPNADGSVTWEYTRQPQGTRCYMLTLNQGGVLQKIDQVITEANFARIEKGWSAEQVRRLLGQAAGEAKFPLKPEVVREWRMEPKTPGNNAFFHVHFTPDGFVTHTSRREEPPLG